MLVSYLPDPENHYLWPAIEDMLKPAGDYPPRADDEFVWVAFEGSTIFAAGTTLLCGDDAQIRMCAGVRHRDWVEQAEQAVSAWARQCGAKRLTMRGRKGWARYLRAFGWVASQSDEQFDYEKVL